MITPDALERDKQKTKLAKGPAEAAVNPSWGNLEPGFLHGRGVCELQLLGLFGMVRF